MKNKITLAIHGGAGTLIRGMMTPEKEKEYRQALDQALNEGYIILENGGTAVDAVARATCLLEDSPLFNAGRGSVFSASGQHEMDAAIMEGKNLNAGAVSLVHSIKNPIALAREVMEHSDHVFLAGQGAMEFADSRGFSQEQDEYFFDQFRYDQWQEIKDTGKVQLDHSAKKDSKFGTVGAVACDKSGNLAAATSTGGMTNKKFGRIGDSPIIGSGTYANNQTCAVSCTGNGEFFIRAVAAYDVAALMDYKGLNLEEAGKEVVFNKLLEIKGEGGLIAVDRFGNVTLPFNSEGMYRAFKNSDGESLISIYND